MEIIQFEGRKKEIAILNSFYNLLKNQYLSSKDLMLKPEKSIKNEAAKIITPDKSIKNRISNDWGDWQTFPNRWEDGESEFAEN